MNTFTFSETTSGSSGDATSSVLTSFRPSLDEGEGVEEEADALEEVENGDEGDDTVAALGMCALESLDTSLSTRTAFLPLVLRPRSPRTCWSSLTVLPS